MKFGQGLDPPSYGDWRNLSGFFKDGFPDVSYPLFSGKRYSIFEETISKIMNIKTQT